MPPVSDPAEDSDVTGFDVGTVGDDLRATVFGYVGHLFPQSLYFLILWLLGAFGIALCSLCFAKTSLALIAESVQLLLKLVADASFAARFAC